MKPAVTRTRAEIVASLGRVIDGVLRPLVAGARACALLDFSNYANVGDNAIWPGERAYLRRLGLPVVYACDHSTYSEARLRARLPEGPILLQGGGNLGDVWLAYEAFREEVITAFPEPARDSPGPTPLRLRWRGPRPWPPGRAVWPSPRLARPPCRTP